MKRLLNSLAVVVIICAALVITLNMWLAPRIKAQLIESVRRDTPFELEVGELTITLPDHVSLSEVRLSESGRDTEFLLIQELKLVLDLGRLIRRENGFKEIRFDQPHFTWDRPEPGWKKYLIFEPASIEPKKIPKRAEHDVVESVPAIVFQEAAVGTADGVGIAVPQGEGQSFHADKIIVYGGSAALRDPTLAEPIAYHIVDIEADVGPVHVPQEPGNITFSFSARLDGTGRTSNVTAQGWVEPSLGDMDIEMVVKGFDLAAVQPYYKELFSGGLRGGWVDLNLTAQVEEQLLKAHCNAVLRGLTFSDSVSELNIFGIPGTFLISYLGKEGKLELEFPIEVQLDAQRIPWEQIIAQAVQQALQKFLVSDVKNLMNAGEVMLQNILSGDESLNQNKNIQKLRNDLGGLFGGFLAPSEEEAP